MSCKRKTFLLAALAVLFASVTNAHAHIHLCFDGQQPPVTIHGAQDSDHAHYGNPQNGDEQNCYGDLDLDLRDEGIAKSFKPDLPANTAHGALVLAVVVAAAPAPLAFESVLRTPDPPYTRPQSRAPPTILL